MLSLTITLSNIKIYQHTKVFITLLF